MTNPEVEVDGTWRTISRGEVYIGSAWRTITRAEYYDGSHWKAIATFVPTLSLSVDPLEMFLNASFKGHATVTGDLAATPTGGLGPYLYAWTLTDVIGGLPSLSSATSASTVISCTVGINQTVTCTAHCVVTDSLGHTASADSLITITNDGGF